MKIYLVDDSEYIRNSLKDLLGDMPGIRICGETGNATDAVREILAFEPNVVILDIRMPNGDGLDVLKRVKSARPGINIIIFTDFPFPQYKERAHELGADFFLEKSVDFEKMAEILTDIAGVASTR